MTCSEAPAMIGRDDPEDPLGVAIQTGVAHGVHMVAEHGIVDPVVV